MKTRQQIQERRRALGVALGILGVAALTLACGEKKSPTSTETTTTPVASTATTPLQQPSASEPIGPASPEVQMPAAPPDPARARTAWQEGVSLFESGDYSGASAALQVAADGRPDEPYVRYLLGLSLWKAGKNAEAEKAMLRAAELDEGSVKTRVNLARVRMDLGDAQGALDAADAGLGIDATSVDLLHQRGRALAALRRTDEALETLGKARAAEPGNGYVANTLGHTLL